MRFALDFEKGKPPPKRNHRGDGELGKSVQRENRKGEGEKLASKFVFFLWLMVGRIVKCFQVVTFTNWRPALPAGGIKNEQ